MAGLTENKANSANPAELELGLSWAELGKNANHAIINSSSLYLIKRMYIILDNIVYS